MPGNSHGDDFENSGARQVASHAAAQVVNEKPFESGLSTSGVPRLANVADLLSSLVKDKRTVDAPALGSLLNSSKLAERAIPTARHFPPLIEKLSLADFEPERCADEYRERALAMIEKKVEGQEIKAVAPAPRRTGQVVDIFAALKKSLETAGQQKRQTADRGKRKMKA